MADLKGKVAIIDVWGTWCPPCRMEIPHFVELQDKYKDAGPGEHVDGPEQWFYPLNPPHH